MRMDDHQARLAGIQAYNDWLLDDFSSADPRRLIGMCVIPNIGVEGAIAELKRVKKKGCKGVMIKTWPSGADVMTRDDDPFWAACEAEGVPVSIHVRLGGLVSEKKRTEMSGASMSSLFWHGATHFTPMPDLMLQFIFGGTHDRFPGLRVCAAEVGVGWI